MTAFERINPAALFLWFLSITVSAAVSGGAVAVGISLIFAAVTYSLIVGKNKTHIYFFILFAVLSVITPLFNHRGNTVLLVVNNVPVTLEALICGIYNAAAVIAVIYWFRVFSAIMTDDRVLYIFGRFSKKLALVISVALRYIPLLGERTVKVREACKVQGLYEDGNIIARLKSEVKVFSAVTTYALEKGMITADSMEARGYGTARRTQYTSYRFKVTDAAMISVSLLLCASGIFCAAKGYVGMEFFPDIILPKFNAFSVLFNIMYFVAAALPCLIFAKEELKWKRLLSKLKT